MATLSEEPDAGWEGGFVFALREVFDHDGNVAAWLMLPVRKKAWLKTAWLGHREQRSHCGHFSIP